MIGVWRAGAHVRRRVGMSSKPIASRKARWAPRRRAFVYRRPLVALPGGDRLLVALDGTAFRHLTASPQAPYELPDLREVMAHPAVDLYHGGDALQGPQLVGKAMRPGPFSPERHQVRVGLVVQCTRRPRYWFGGERRVAASLPSRSPLRHRPHRRLHPAGHRAHAQALLSKRHRAAAPSF